MTTNNFGWKMNEPIEDVIARAIERFSKLPQQAQEAERKAQVRSFVKAELRLRYPHMTEAQAEKIVADAEARRAAAEGR